MNPCNIKRQFCYKASRTIHFNPISRFFILSFGLIQAIPPFRGKMGLDMVFSGIQREGPLFEALVSIFY